MIAHALLNSIGFDRINGRGRPRWLLRIPVNTVEDKTIGDDIMDSMKWRYFGQNPRLEGRKEDNLLERRHVCKWNVEAQS